MTGDMVMTRSRLAEGTLRLAEEQTMDPDPRAKWSKIGGVKYVSPVGFADVLPKDFKGISTKPWFTCQAVLADENNRFASLK